MLTDIMESIQFISSPIKSEKSALNIYSFNSNELVHKCINDVKDELIINPVINIYGRVAIQHRSIGFFSNDSIGYHYSGQLAKSKPLTNSLKELLETINNKFGTQFNGILVNKYMNGLDYIGAHSDNESYLDSGGVISISVGAVRKFRIRNKITKKIIVDVPTVYGCILHMNGDFQKEFTHEIPKETKIKDARYSLTFRNHTK